MPNSDHLGSSSNEAALGVTPDANTALRKLVNEISDLHVEAVRGSMGNTNAAVLKLRRDEAQSVLDASLSTIKEMREALEDLCAAYQTLQGAWPFPNAALDRARSVLTKYPETNK